jgi:hypothetical protein
VQVRDAGGGHGLDEAEPDAGGQVAEEGASATEQDRNLVNDHLVDQPRCDRRGERDAALDGDVLVARELAGTLDGCLYRVGEELSVAACSTGCGRWLTTTIGAVGCGLPPSNASESS